MLQNKNSLSMAYGPYHRRKLALTRLERKTEKTFYKKSCAMKYRCILYIASILNVLVYFVNTIVTEYLNNSILKNLSENNSGSLRILVDITGRLLENNFLPEKNQQLSN